MRWPVAVLIGLVCPTLAVVVAIPLLFLVAMFLAFDTSGASKFLWLALPLFFLLLGFLGGGAAGFVSGARTSREGLIAGAVTGGFGLAAASIGYLRHEGTQDLLEVNLLFGLPFLLGAVAGGFGSKKLLDLGRRKPATSL